MLRTAVAALLAVPALLVAAPAHAASPTTLLAETGNHGTVSLTEGTKSRGTLHVTSCANTSPTAFVCKGTGTVFELTGKLRIRWTCPVDKPCAKKAEGTLKSHGNLLGLLHIKASVVTFQAKGSQFGIVWDPTPERAHA